jgi:hypothetical protein
MFDGPADLAMQRKREATTDVSGVTVSDSVTVSAVPENTMA